MKMSNIISYNGIAKEQHDFAKRRISQDMKWLVEPFLKSLTEKFNKRCEKYTNDHHIIYEDVSLVAESAIYKLMTDINVLNFKISELEKSKDYYREKYFEIIKTLEKPSSCKK